MNPTPSDHPPSSEALRFIRDSLHTKQSRREVFVLVLAVVGLLVAFIPFGMGIIQSLLKGVVIACQDFAKTRPFDFRILFAAVWTVLAILMGNLQIAFSLVAFHRKSNWLHNPILKVGTLIAQLLWIFPGVIFYFWYAWVASSVLLFWITPLEHFSWTNLKGHKPPTRLPADDVAL